MERNSIRLTWYPIAKLQYACAAIGADLRRGWIDHGGAYGMCIPVEVANVIERIDWSRIDVDDALLMLND